MIRSSLYAVIALLLTACVYAAPRLTEGDLKESVSPPALAWGQADTVVFAVYGDNRLSGDSADRNPDSVRRKRRRAVTSSIAAASPGFVANTGDLVERGSEPELWTAFVEDTAPLLRERFFYPVAGNHDYKGGLSDRYFDLFEKAIGNAKSYAFRSGPACFIFLDSAAKPAPASDDTRNVHARWFRERLEEAAGSRYLFVVLHHPVFSSGYGRVVRFLFYRHAGQAPRSQERRLRAILADHLAQRKARDPGARTVVFSGHSHFYERFVYRDVDFVTTGGGGAPSHTPAESPPPHRVTAYRGDHYVLVKVTEDRLNLHFQPVGPGRWIQKEAQE